MALATNALTTLAVVKDELDITDNDMDSKLERWINAASDFVQKYIGRSLGKNQITVDKNGAGSQYLILENTPILTIDSVLYGTVPITDYDVNTEDYKRGTLFREQGWVYASLIAGLVGEPVGERRVYTIQYTYGYVLPQDDGAPDPRTLPYDIEDVVIGIVTAKYTKQINEAYGLSGLKQGRLSYSFSDSELSQSQQVALNQYRKLSF